MQFSKTVKLVLVIYFIRCSDQFVQANGVTSYSPCYFLNCGTQECRLKETFCRSSVCPVLAVCVKVQPSPLICPHGDPVLDVDDMEINCSDQRICPRNTFCWTYHGQVGNSSSCCWRSSNNHRFNTISKTQNSTFFINELFHRHQQVLKVHNNNTKERKQTRITEKQTYKNVWLNTRIKGDNIRQVLSKSLTGNQDSNNSKYIIINNTSNSDNGRWNPDNAKPGYSILELKNSMMVNGKTNHNIPKHVIGSLTSEPSKSDSENDTVPKLRVRRGPHGYYEGTGSEVQGNKVPLVKSGECSRVLRGKWYLRCMDTCFNDADCPSNLKCCDNGCARSCQYPVVKFNPEIPAKTKKLAGVRISSSIGVLGCKGASCTSIS